MNKYIKTKGIMKIINKPTIFKSADDISMDGAINLVADILRYACEDYKTALKTIMKLRDKFKKIEPKVRAWDEYDILKKTVNEIKHSRYKTYEDLMLIEQYKSITTTPKEPTKKEFEIYNTYQRAMIDKISIENFYKSARYTNYTLQMGMDGEEVIQTIKNEVNWIER